jgi:DNA-binding NarL/FixJ family response regulator
MKDAMASGVAVLVVDPHDVDRLGLCALVSGAAGFTVAGSEADAHRAVGSLQLHWAADETNGTGPRLVMLLDEEEAGQPGMIPALRGAGPSVAVVVAAASGERERLMAALRLGADGYVLKSSPKEEILSVLRSAAAGRPAMDRALTEALFGVFHEDPPAPEPLTKRELEVLDALAAGCTNKEIAGRLSVSLGTVKVHVEHILAKFAVAGRTEAAVKAIEMGIVTNRMR